MMKRSNRRLAIIFVMLFATLIVLCACDLTGLSDALKTDISKCEITFSAISYEYTGVEIEPDANVKYGNRILEKDVDYDVAYSNNIEVGTAHATFSGKGNFKGQVTKDFDIVEPKIIYTFSIGDAQVLSGTLIQSLSNTNDLVVPVVKKFGYDFLCWVYEGEVFDFDLDTLPEQDSTFTAVFSLNTYSIQYVLNGGTNSLQNKSEFTVEDLFVLEEAERVDKQFAGWYLDDEFDERIYSLSGYDRNLVLYAKFVDFDYKKVTYVTPDDVDYINYDMVYPNTVLQRPAEVLSIDGSKKLVWYLDEDMTIRHNLRNMPNEDISLYARWEDTLYAGFLDRGWYNLSDIKSIDSYDDLLAYVEFVCYYNITAQTKKSITYLHGAENILAELKNALSESTFPRMIGLSYDSYDNACLVYMSSSVSGQATLSATAKEDFYPQIGNAFNNYQSNRSANFDDFAINYVDKTYECETSDQLFYVLSHGYRPLTVSGSSAYRIYNKFKEIMREICDDRMTDVQKARAIFDWLIINVYYDNNVASENLPQATYKYEAFYLEGVLNGSAVCDGLSKAYSVMCAIEGIDCVRVTGKLKSAKEGDAGHAWNKLQIMGEWYLSDSTWGNRVVKVTDNDNDEFYEYVNGEYFLFTDEVRNIVDNYNSEQYTYYVADGEYNFYSNYGMQLEFKTLLGTSTYIRKFDLYIDGDASQNFDAITELSYVFEYVDKNSAVLDGMSFCIMLGENMSSDDVYDAMRTYVDRVGFYNARIKSYSLISDINDIVDEDNKIYGEGAILTIILSLPSAS